MATPRRTAVRLAGFSKPVSASSDWRDHMAERVARTAPRLDERVERLAACAGLDIDIFFPHESHTTAVDRAKAVCQTCPVIRECLVQALRIGDGFAILGGTTPGERRLIRRRLVRRKRELGVPV
ncbi:transcription factor WhiB [Actinobacteria bacterium OK074]|nr:transcription factor WhiB [Actinobacteria bacterium OK074]